LSTIIYSEFLRSKSYNQMVSLVERMLELHQQKQHAASEAARARLEREINVTDEQKALTCPSDWC